MEHAAATVIVSKSLVVLQHSFFIIIVHNDTTHSVYKTYILYYFTAILLPRVPSICTICHNNKLLYP
jgi:hypothetical protein